MDEFTHKARFDWLVEIAGAVAAGLATGFAALKLAPSFGFDAAVGTTASGLAGFGLGLLAMKTVKPEAREHAFADFSLGPIAVGDVLDVSLEPLLLEGVHDSFAAPRDEAEADELLLDDPLVANPESRVVHLFASQAMPTAGELKKRIDSHQAADSSGFGRVSGEPDPDASDALYAALADLRRSLR